MRCFCQRLFAKKFGFSFGWYLAWLTISPRKLWPRPISVHLSNLMCVACPKNYVSWQPAPDSGSQLTCSTSKYLVAHITLYWPNSRVASREARVRLGSEPFKELLHVAAKRLSGTETGETTANATIQALSPADWQDRSRLFADWKERSFKII